ncbi:glycosyltransferase family 4 protein [Rosistilla carotiformis]|uniref:glycosyltransferase family 4 protein n=1 Tax=Rosistilla carotiformis TaxID=2528017 RepID=UPI0018D27070|nr:glycosyltransferase family 4 protein [Rosistilla carotiformis]
MPQRKLAAIEQAELLIFNSEFTRRRFESFHSVNVDQVVVPLTFEMPACDIDPLSPRRPWILTVGRMEPDRPKGHAETLAVLPQVIERVPDLQWHVVGAGKHLDSFRKQVLQSGCQEHVVIHGFLTNEKLLELYRQSRVFCMPSHGEGFGIVYLEAMSQGCVPIGSTEDAAAEVIGDGGVCVDLAQPDHLAVELEALLTMGSERFDSMSMCAIARSELFSPARFAVRFDDALQRLS